MPRVSDQPIQIRNNPYHGPNAHLLSLQQTPRPNAGGTWHSFHNTYIAAITFALNDRLPEGYTAVGEQSLQIEIELPTLDVERLPHRLPDVSTYQNKGYQPARRDRSLTAITAPNLVFPIEDSQFDTELTAISIYKAVPHLEPGQIVARIEVLSPANKRDGRGFAVYRKGRFDAIQSGTLLYELDLLHETAAPLYEIPVYWTDDGSHPYYIAATDPRQAETQVKFFEVDDPFPMVNILLLGDDRVQDFDFGVPYNETFERGRWGRLIDYADDPDPTRQQIMQEKLGHDVPPALATYSLVDQQRIHAKMIALSEKTRQTE